MDLVSFNTTFDVVFRYASCSCSKRCSTFLINIFSCLQLKFISWQSLKMSYSQISEPVNFAECRLLLLVIDFKIIFYMPQEKKLNSFRSIRVCGFSFFPSGCLPLAISQFISAFNIWGAGEEYRQDSNPSILQFCITGTTGLVRYTTETNTWSGIMKVLLNFE